LSSKSVLGVLSAVDAIDKEDSPKIITYNLAMFPAAERMKELKKRNGKNTFMKLGSDEPFDTWKAQLLVRIEQKLAPDTLDFANYEVNFTVARISTAPMAVSVDEEYSDMLERVSRSKDLVCAIYIQELQQMASSKVSQCTYYSFYVSYNIFSTET
jgi:hypothetical protein